MTTTDTMPTSAEWHEIARNLQAPFDPADVDFRAQGKPNAQGKTQVVCYIDARVVQDRLDAVVGPGNWSFDWTPLVVEKGEVMVAKGTLTLFGVAKSDAGSASNFDQTLGAVSHALKRAAVQWGVGRYLYGQPAAWVENVTNGRIPAEKVRELRARLPHPQNAPQSKSDGAHARNERSHQPAQQSDASAATVRQGANGAASNATSDAPTWSTLRLRARKQGIETEDEWGRFLRDNGVATTEDAKRPESRARVLAVIAQMEAAA